jgi:hypothetical protein
MTMSGDEPILTAGEERAAAALKLALQDVSEQWPLRADVAAWVASVPKRQSLGHRLPVGMAAALAMIIVGAVAFAAWPKAVPGGGGASPSAVPSIPGTPGHFDNGSFSFDYPASWRTLSDEYYEGMENQVFAVLGTGDWKTGCYFTSNGGGCTGDTVDVSGGRVVVKVYERGGGPVSTCGTSPANATLGPNAVSKSTDGSATTWEIRMPGGDFGWTNNVFVEAWAGGPQQMAQAEALVASFRWADGVSNPDNCFQNETPSPGMAHYDADGTSFDYPAGWSILSGYEHWGLHGPTIHFAVGTGTVDSGCTVSANQGVSCGAPSLSATGDQVVVFWYGGASLFSNVASMFPSLPTGSLPPGETRVTVAGAPAIASHGDGWAKWQLSPAEYIEANWGPDATDAEAQVDALIGSLSLGQ